MTTENTNTEANNSAPEGEVIKTSTAKASEEVKSNKDTSHKNNFSEKTDDNVNHSKGKANIRDAEDYLLELREENRQRRLAEENTRKELEKLQKELLETKTLAERERTRANEIRVFSELKSEAIKAGINDIEDVYKLADISKVVVNERGEITGAADLINELKSSKPYLFRNTSTSLGHQVPHPNSIEKPAKEKLSAEEQEQRIREIKQRYSR